MNTRFQKPVDYSTCRLDRKYSMYDCTVSKNVSKMPNRMNIRIESQAFDPLGPISIIEFLCSFKQACDINIILKRTEICLFNFFMEKSAATSLNALQASKHKAQTRTPSAGKATKMDTFPKVTIIFRSAPTPRTGGNPADTEDDIVMLYQPTNIMSLQYAKALEAMELCRREA